MKLLKKILVALLVVFIMAQFFRPDKNVGDIASINAFFEDTNPPEQVKSILQESCFDCHSDVTKYPWYNNITPVNYWIQGHIDHGSEHFNVSKWNDNSIKRKDHKLEELIELVEKREMPLPSYRSMHNKADLSDAQIKAVVEWAKGVRLKYQLTMPKPQ